MTDPATVMAEISEGAAALDQLGKDIDAAVDRFLKAEGAWEEAYDAAADQLSDEYRDEGRKSSPSEHAITTAARSTSRPVWREYRAAKKHLDRIETRISAARAAMNGRQSELGALRDEARVPASAQPQWSRQAA